MIGVPKYDGVPLQTPVGGPGGVRDQGIQYRVSTVEASTIVVAGDFTGISIGIQNSAATCEVGGSSVARVAEVSVQSRPEWAVDAETQTGYMGPIANW